MKVAEGHAISCAAGLSETSDVGALVDVSEGFIYLAVVRTKLGHDSCGTGAYFEVRDCGVFDEQHRALLASLIATAVRAEGPHVPAYHQAHPYSLALPFDLFGL